MLQRREGERGVDERQGEKREESEEWKV